MYMCVTFPYDLAAAAALLVQVDLGNTATGAFPAATSVEQFKRWFFVFFSCGWVGTWLPYSDEATIHTLGCIPFYCCAIPVILLYLGSTSTSKYPGLAWRP